jgi:hypothetical protein
VCFSRLFVVCFSRLFVVCFSRLFVVCFKGEDGGWVVAVEGVNACNIIKFPN